MSALLAAAEKLTTRLRILQKLQAQCRERQEVTIELHVSELFEPGDLEAIEAWEKALAEATGAQPLPFEVTS
jgi:hypothetical protein